MTEKGARILLIEDEPNIAEGILFNLELEGFQCIHAVTGEEGLEALAQASFDLVVLDLMLPGIDGIEVCRLLRQRDPQLPVLMLTARADEADRVAGLESGADDYLTKPFSLAEFLLRVRGMLRRSSWYRGEALREPVYRFGEVEVQLNEGWARTPRETIELTSQELKVLRLFFNHEGQVLTREKLLAEAWGMSPKAETRTLDNFIVRLRRYFETDPSDPKHFRTVRGRGYRFVREPEQEKRAP